MAWALVELASVGEARVLVCCTRTAVLFQGGALIPPCLSPPQVQNHENAELRDAGRHLVRLLKNPKYSVRK
jgi:hypothetical protein